jgi:hypothetical protein
MAAWKFTAAQVRVNYRKYGAIAIFVPASSDTATVGFEINSVESLSVGGPLSKFAVDGRSNGHG